MGAAIQNFKDLAISPNRELVLKVGQAGLEAIDTQTIMKKQIGIKGDLLTVDGQTFNLADFEKIYVISFGKASAKATETLEEILGERIAGGVSIGKRLAKTTRIRSFVGTHPLPSMENVKAAGEMEKLISRVTEKDLVFCLITGGGSAMLCWDEEECKQGIQLYNSYLKTGEDIVGLNTVRKHISKAKGGGLAKMLYPATVIGLVFSDIAGGRDNLVDSGPTFYDSSTVSDAQAVIDKYNLGQFNLTETPKEEKYFHKVHNITLVSGALALKAMKSAAEDLGLNAVLVSSEMYYESKETLERLQKVLGSKTLALAGGEIKLIVDRPGGKGGRNCYLPMHALKVLGENDVFMSLASDGLDNGDSAGAIVDFKTNERLKAASLDVEAAIAAFDGFTLFEKSGHELIFTGPTEANVADFLLWYRE